MNRYRAAALATCAILWTIGFSADVLGVWNMPTEVGVILVTLIGCLLLIARPSRVEPIDPGLQTGDHRALSGYDDVIARNQIAYAAEERAATAIRQPAGFVTSVSCPHSDAVPVDSVVTGERLAWWCPSCATQLDADFDPALMTDEYGRYLNPAPPAIVLSYNDPAAPTDWRCACGKIHWIQVGARREIYAPDVCPEPDQELR